MNWIKGLGISVKVAALAFLAALAVFAAKRQKASAEKWHDKAVDVELGKVKSGTMTAKAASTKAKLHDAKADEIKKKAEARITEMGGKDNIIINKRNKVFPQRIIQLGTKDKISCTSSLLISVLSFSCGM